MEGVYHKRETHFASLIDLFADVDALDVEKLDWVATVLTQCHKTFLVITKLAFKSTN